MSNNIWFVFATLSKVGFVMAIPVAVFAYLGRKIDLYYHTSPLFILSGMGIALTISSLIIYRMIKKIENK